MKKFLTSLFSSENKENPEKGKEKEESKKFDILKYDGVRALRIGQTTYAIKCFQEALNIREDFETMGFLVSAYTIAQMHEAALDVLNRMVELQPEHIETLLTRVNILFFLDKDTEATPDCLRVLELDSTNHPAYFLMAKAKRTGGDTLGAIADLTKAVSLKDDFINAYLLRAEILLSMKQGEEALPDIEKVIALAPEEETTYLLRGKIHESLNNIEAATADYQLVLDLNPFNNEAWILSGNLLITQKKFDEAIALFDEAIDTIPGFAKAYAERGRAKNEKGDKNEAFEDLRQSIELNPESEEAQRINGQHSNFDNLYKGGIF